LAVPKITRARRLADGVCRDCGAPIATTVFCEEHAERARRYASERYQRSRPNPRRRMAKLISGARHRCRKSGLPLDEEYLAEFVENPPLRCQATGVLFDYSARGVESRCLSSPSLDRIDPTKGYVRGNVAVVLDIINRMRSDIDPGDTRLLAELLTAAADFYERKAGLDG
jgi:hypothetical protein